MGLANVIILQGNVFATLHTVAMQHAVNVDLIDTITQNANVFSH